MTVGPVPDLLLAPLPEAAANRLLALWDEYNSLATPEARIAKGLDEEYAVSEVPFTALDEITQDLPATLSPSLKVAR